MWPWIALTIACHFGLRLAIYNRLNSLGWTRPWIKRTEIVLAAETLVTPAILAWVHGGDLAAVATGELSWQALPTELVVYAAGCLAMGSILGSLWLIWRPIFRVQCVEAMRQVVVHDLTQLAGEPLARTTKCRWAAAIPGNQIFELSVERIDLPVRGLPADLDGYRIAHLSDIHLTGQISPAMSTSVMEIASGWQPDMFALTGDIVDKPIGIDWLPEIFGRATARDGCHFILGNHDTRVSDPEVVRRAMKRLGWNDLGGRSEPTTLRQTPARLIGNESPWFGRPRSEDVRVREIEFRLCLSHSPDQFDWCRRHDVHLMLAGHTHGGQGRLPLIGPLLSPSRHGSRWASGDFYRAPTTLHVSRGISGVHLLRIRCRPELSLLTLRPA